MTDPRRPRAARAAIAAGLAMVLASASCRVPERMAGVAADRLLAMWQSVRSNDAVVETTPDLLRRPERTVRTRAVTADLQKRTYRYLTRVLAPEPDLGTATGGRWGGAWAYDARTRTLLSLRGMRAWNQAANARILTRVVRQSFAQYDFQRSGGTRLGRPTEIVTATPLAADRYRWKAATESDAKTGYAYRSRFFDDQGREISGWDTSEYKIDGPLSDADFDPPAKDPAVALRFAVGAPDNLARERGRLAFAPVVIPGRRGVHLVQEAAPGVWGVVSDYTDADGSLAVVQWPAGRGRVRVPFARPVAMDAVEVAVTLVGPYLLLLWSDGKRELAALGEMDGCEMLHLVSTLHE